MTIRPADARLTDRVAEADRPIELCLASPMFFPTHGGAELRFLHYLPGLRDRGVDTRVVTGTPKTKKITARDRASDWYRLRPGARVPSEPVNGFPIHRVRLPDNSGWRRTAVFNHEIVRFCGQPGYRPDVVQLLAPLPPRSIPWLWRLRSLGVATAFAYTIAAKSARSGMCGWLRRLELRALYNQLDCLIVANAPLREELRALGVRTHVEMIPNGIDLRRFRRAADSAERSAPRRARGIGDDATLIFSVGAVSPRKGADVLLEAFSTLAQRFPKLHVAIAGPRRDLEDRQLEVYRRRIEALVSGSGAADRIHFLGQIRDVDAWLRASDLFVFPSEREGMPNAVLEAMATECPVVLVPFAGLSDELGQPGEHYLRVAREPGALAAAIEQLVGDAGLRRKLGTNARAFLEQTMELGDTLDRYAALYREIAH